MPNISPKRAIAKIKKIRDNLSGLSDRVEKSVLNRQHGNMSTRIFINGIATDGRLITSKVNKKEIGDYGKQQGRIRQANNRNVSPLNLDNTGRHMKSIIVGTNGKKNVLGLSNDLQRRIASGHQDYRKKEIYPATKDEKKEMDEVAIAEVRAFIKEQFR